MSDRPGWYWDPDEVTSDEQVDAAVLTAEPTDAGVPIVAPIDAPVDSPSGHADIAQDQVPAELQTVEPRSAEQQPSEPKSAGQQSSSRWGHRTESAEPRSSFLASKRVRVAIGICIAFFVVAITVVEVVGRFALERTTASQLREQGVAGEVSVDIGRSWWTPSITRLLLTRTLDRAQVELSQAQLLVVPVERAHYELEDMKVSLSFGSRSLRVTSLGEGRVLLVVDPSTVEGFLGVKVTARSGLLYIGESTTPAAVAVDGTELAIDSPDLVAVNGTTHAAFPIVDSYLLPCTPSAKVVGSFIELACSGSELPGVLAQAIGPQPKREPTDMTQPPELGPSESTVLEPGEDSGLIPGSGPDGASGGLTEVPATTAPGRPGG